MKSLAEIAAHWSLDDLLDANLALDLWDELEAKAIAEAKQRAQ